MVLLVDDDEDFRLQVARLLTQNGFNVLCAKNGEEAICSISEKPFKLMITDLNMPGMDGFMLSRQALALSPGMPILMITGSIDADIPTLAKETGISLLYKSFNPDKLITKVRKMLQPIQCNEGETP